jgi:hypothetical protein
MGNTQKNHMETISLKALANKVLRGNSQGNLSETGSFQRRKLERVKSAEVSTIGNRADREDPEDTREAYEERAAIMEYDGGLGRDEAERLAWCGTACMLFCVTQWEACERFKPKPCLKLIEYRRD